MSQSHLFSQLEYLNLGASDAERWDFVADWGDYDDEDQDEDGDEEEDEDQDDDEDQDGDEDYDPQFPPGLLAILTNSRVSNLKTLKLGGLIEGDLQHEHFNRGNHKVLPYFEHLGDCKLEYPVNFH